MPACVDSTSTCERLCRPEGQGTYGGTREIRLSNDPADCNLRPKYLGWHSR